jgi:hypothetical protein
LTVEVVGYIGRAVSNSNPLALGPFITQALTILLAPPLFAASIYMVLGRTIVLLHAEHHSIISVKWLTKVFVGGDVLSFLTQSAGGGIQTGNTLADYNLGQNLIMAGLGIQLAFFGFFIIAAGIFHFKIIRDPTPIAASMGSSSGWRPSERSWSILLLRSEVKNGVGFGRPLWNHLIGGRESNSAIFLLTRAELRRNNPAFSHTKSIVLFLNVCL